MLKNTAKKLFALFAFGLFAAGTAHASDLDILTQVKSTNTPNVLIVMDISGSMSNDDIIATGRREIRLNVAKQVITEIVEENPNMRWGFMTFPDDYDYTGVLQLECQDMSDAYMAQLKKAISDQIAIGQTPIANALAEAGLYFAGGTSYIHDTKYTSPVQNKCQPNYVILLTDGMSQKDSGIKPGSVPSNDDDSGWANARNLPSVLWSEGAYMGRTIGDYITNHDLGYLFDDPDFRLEASLVYIREANITIDTVWSSVADFTITKQQILALQSAGKPYVYGYNPDNPSRSIPPLYFYTGFDGTKKMSLREVGYYKGTQVQVFLHGSDYLDDVAAFLYNEDLLPGMGAKGDQFEKQNVKTFAIGFRVDDGLLLRAAVQGGTGKAGYMTADNYEQLKEAFTTVVTSIKEDAVMFVTPSLPVNQEGTYSGDKMYLGLFKPQSASWAGNLKRYTLKDDSMNAYVNEDGSIRDDVKSDWSLVTDGSDVTAGGAAGVLEQQLARDGFSRKVGTYIDGSATKGILDKDNLISKDNTKLTAAMLGVANDVEREALIRRLNAMPFGPVIHSQVVLERYGNDIIIFVGANDGFLHAIDDKDGSEKWVFAMPEHLGQLKNAGIIMPTEDQYYVDGQVTAMTADNGKYLVFGARRGGYTYAALDITDYDNPKFMYQIPGLPQSSHKDDFKDINWGQSWGKPQMARAFHGVTSTGTFNAVDNTCASIESDVAFELNSGDSSQNYVVVVPGGYDPQYDGVAPNKAVNPAGNAVAGVYLTSGAAANSFALLNGKASPIMRHSIVDVSLVTDENDMITDMYFGDLGGNVFYAFPYQKQPASEPCANGGEQATFAATDQYVPYLLFQSEPDVGRRIMYAPDVVFEHHWQYIYFGTGNRTDPLSGDVQDRFYCIKNNFDRLAMDPGDDNFITDTDHGDQQSNDLVDVTDNVVQTGSEEEQQLAQALLEEKLGWYINLAPGEKVVSTPIVYNGKVFFTSYIPDEPQEPTQIEVTVTVNEWGSAPTFKLPLTGGGSSSGGSIGGKSGAPGDPTPEDPIDKPDPTSDDICVASSTSGQARIYALDYKTGAAAMDLNKDGEVSDTDRFDTIGGTIPSEPVLGIFEGAVKIYVGVNNGIYELDLGAGESMNVFFWHEYY